MKHIAIIFILAVSSASLHAQTFAEQVKSLKSAPNWTEIEKALTTLRTDLTTANQAAIVDAVAVFRAERDDAKTAAGKAAKEAQEATKSKADAEAKVAATATKLDAVEKASTAAERKAAIEAFKADLKADEKARRLAELAAQKAAADAEITKLNTP